MDEISLDFEDLDTLNTQWLDHSSKSDKILFLDLKVSEAAVPILNQKNDPKVSLKKENTDSILEEKDITSEDQSRTLYSKNIFQKIGRFVRKHPVASIAIVGGVAVLAGVAIAGAAAAASAGAAAANSSKNSNDIKNKRSSSSCTPPQGKNPQPIEQKNIIPKTETPKTYEDIFSTYQSDLSSNTFSNSSFDDKWLYFEFPNQNPNYITPELQKETTSIPSYEKFSSPSFKPTEKNNTSLSNEQKETSLLPNSFKKPLTSDKSFSVYQIKDLKLLEVSMNHYYNKPGHLNEHLYNNNLEKCTKVKDIHLLDSNDSNFGSNLKKIIEKDVDFLTQLAEAIEKAEGIVSTGIGIVEIAAGLAGLGSSGVLEIGTCGGASIIAVPVATSSVGLIAD